MSKKTGRRAILAGLAGLAVAPAMSVAVAGEPRGIAADPVLEMLAELPELRNRHEAAASALGRIEDEFVKEALPANHVKFRGQMIFTLADFDHEFTRGCFAEIGPHDADVVALRKELARALKTRKAAAGRLGMAKARNRERAAFGSMREHEDAILESEPVTPAGALALLGFVAELVLDREDEAEQAEIFSGAIRSALATLEGRALS
jgi:hypothetical protein